MALLLVFVRAGDDTFPIELPAEGCIGDLHRAVAEATGMPRGRLLFGGAALEDDSMPLADSGLSSECVVEVDTAEGVVHVVWVNYDPDESWNSSVSSSSSRRGSSSSTSTSSSSSCSTAPTSGSDGSSEAPREVRRPVGLFDSLRAFITGSRDRAGGAPPVPTAQNVAYAASAARPTPSITCPAAVLRLHTKYRRAAESAAVPPADSDAGRRVLAEHAAAWSEQTGLRTEGPLNRAITLRHLLSDFVYSEGTKEREEMMEHLRLHARGQVEQTTVPYGHVTLSGDVTAQVAPSSGAWMYEVGIVESPRDAVRVGWIQDGRPPSEMRQAVVGDAMLKTPSWAACTLCGAVNSPSTESRPLWLDLFAIAAEGSEDVEAVPLKAGEHGEWHWGEGDTIATCFDFDRRQILYGMPGKGWFVAFSDVDVSAPVKPALAALNGLLAINFGDKPFECDPPVSGCRGIVQCSPTATVSLQSPGPRVLLGRAGTLMDGEPTHPESPFTCGWPGFFARRALAREQRCSSDGSSSRSRSSDVSDDPPGAGPALLTLLEASTTAERPHGSGVLLYVVNRCLAASEASEKGHEPPLLPFRAFNARQVSSELSLHEPMWGQNVRHGDVICVQTVV